MPGRLLSRLDRAPLVVIGAAFVVTRVAAAVAGVRYDDSTLSYFWQYADPELLQHDFFRSIWWFHAQPPLFNVYLGSVLHLPDAVREPVFLTTYLALGVAIAIGMYAFATQLGVPRWGAAAATVLFVASPTAIVYENLLFYPYAIAAFLVLTFLGLLRYLQTGSRGWAVLSFGAATVVVLTRSTYHPVWIATVVGAAFLARPQGRRRTMACAAIPIVLVAGLCVKNAVQFGTFTTSSWTGMNLARVVSNEVPDEQKIGILRTAPFSPPESYGAETRAPTGIAILDQLRKPHGAPNYNHEVYAEIGDDYLGDSLRTMKAQPREYIEALGSSARMYVAPATDQPFVYDNVHELGWYSDAYNRFLLVTPNPHYFFPLTGLPDGDEWAPDAKDMSWLPIVAYLLALAILPAVLWRAWRRVPVDAARAWVCGTASATVWLSVAAGIAGDIGENSRFRVESDPLVYVLAAAAVTSLARSWSSARARNRATTATTATAASTASDGSAAALNRVCP